MIPQRTYATSAAPATYSGARLGASTLTARSPSSTVVTGSATVGGYAARTVMPTVTSSTLPTVTAAKAVTAAAPITSVAAAPITATVAAAPVTTSVAAPVATVAPVAVGVATARPLDPSRIIRAAAIYKDSGELAPVYSQPGFSGEGFDGLDTSVANASIFDNVETAPPDAILSLALMFKEDKNPNKVNLGIGAYRTEQGKPWPLPSVLQAQLMVCEDPTEDKEYVPIDGKPDYKAPVQALIFSDDEIASGRLATTQALSGTGALQIVGQFLVNFMNVKVMNLPNPTWGNHNAIFKRAGMKVQSYTYYQPSTRGFDFEGCMAAIDQMNPGEAILLHACAQNPTGVDPTPEQWQAIVEVVRERQLIPVLDNAYQGYASGDLEKDGFAQMVFENAGLEYFVCQSFAKNFGLYGERIGYIHVRCALPDYAKAVLSQLKILIRQAYSSPPRHGAAVVNKVLTTPQLKEQWLQELAFMSNRILEMRDALRRCIEARQTPGTWNHITDQIGMFSFTGLSEAQVKRMVNEFSIYMTKDGRISVAGLNPGNVDYVADCIDCVVRETP